MSSPSVTVWLDPGKTTGIAAWYHEPKIFTSIEADFVSTGYWLELLAQYGNGHCIVNDTDSPGVEIGWEQYIVTPGNTRHGIAYWSLEVIGMARWLAMKNQFTILDPQVSSQMLVATDERLKLLGWYKPGKVHANDAARHLMRSFIKREILPIELWRQAFDFWESG